jgi:hypothetical protein
VAQRRQYYPRDIYTQGREVVDHLTPPDDDARTRVSTSINDFARVTCRVGQVDVVNAQDERWLPRLEPAVKHAGQRVTGAPRGERRSSVDGQQSVDTATGGAYHDEVKSRAR